MFLQKLKLLLTFFRKNYLPTNHSQKIIVIFIFKKNPEKNPEKNPGTNNAKYTGRNLSK
jgi:hypothetical protein